MPYQIKKPIFLLTICIVYILIGSCSTDRKETSSNEVKSLMDTYYNIGQFNGSVIVSEGENIIFKSGYGLANKEWNVFNGPETKFRLGSVTKQFTAALILKLVDEGKLELNQKITDVLPEFKKETGSRVSIAQLLSHTSGISMPRLSFEEYNLIFQKKQTTQQLLDKLCSEDLIFEPGSKFRYSSAGYIVLGAIIEKVTLMAWEEALQEYFFKPLGMEGTGVDDYEKILYKRASGYQTNYGYGNARFKYMPSSFSSGSLYSTVEDMHKWFVGLCSGKILSAESKELLFERHVELRSGYFGYGWFISEKEFNDSTVNIVFHAGDVHGFSAIIYGNPENQQLVVLLTNEEGTHYYEIAENLLKVLNNVPVEKPRKYIADILRKTIYAENIETALNKYEQAVNEGIEKYNTDESELIELGYDLLYVDKIVEAVEVFKITIKLHPNSYDAFDSLGEAYYKYGMHESAITNYKKSLELNSENTNARKMIQLIEKEMDNN